MRLLATLLLLALAAPALTAQEGNAAPRLVSWTSDRPRLNKGDLVTILIDERALASATLRDNASDRRSRGLSANADLAGALSQGATMSSNNDADTRRNGEAVRQSTFSSEVSARVVDVSPGGMLRIEGQKELRVDRARQTIIISGWVRPNDIAASTNTVESWRMADAQVRYQQKGSLAKPRRGIIMRILGWFWP